MKLVFSSSLHYSYFSSLKLFKKSQPEMWKLFCKEVSTFSGVFANNIFLPVSAIFCYIKFFKQIFNSAKLYNLYWESNKDIILKRLDDLFGYKLQNKTYIAYICVTPLFIRNIKKRFFLLPTNSSFDRIVEIIIHELSHFYFYQHKLVQRYDMELVWKLSEQIVPQMIENRFSDICLPSNSYIENPSEVQQQWINRWINGECTFEKLLFETIVRSR